MRRFLKALPVFFVMFCFVTGKLSAQTYINGNLGTGTNSKSGVAAPAGTQWHEMQNNTGNTTETNVSIAFDNTANAAGVVNSRTADDFTVPNGQSWNISTMSFYEVVLPPAPATSPITAIRVQIHSSNPALGPTTVVYGDLTTNRMSATAFANVYAIANSQVPAPGTVPNQNFVVWKVDANINTTLPAGTYWVEWQCVATVRTFALMSQPLNARTVAGYNGVSTFNGGAWAATIDGGNPATAPDVNVDFAWRFNYTAACVSTTPATAPVVSPLPPNVCAGSSVTLSIIGGSLNGASDWKWYTGSCGGTLVGTGNSITVTPGATTTYFVRGEGTCASAPGPCTQRVVTVVNCSCVTPADATICSGTIQKLSVTPGAPVFTTVSGGPGAVVTTAVANATPYPSTLNVAGQPTAGMYVNKVTLTGMNHTFPEDLDIMLLSPTGQSIILMSDCGAGVDLVNNNISFQDGSPALTTAAIVNGTYSPTNLVGAFGVEPDVFTAPGPGTAVSSLAGFTGNVNGGWRLLVTDDAAGDAGNITSWSIEFKQVPVAIWTASPAAPNTMFSDANAGTAYVAGTPTDVIYVNPTTTTTYTANIASGPCAGNNNIVVTVLAKPTIAVTPSVSCSPATLTATGGSSYQWTPSTGLNTTSGAVVIATTPTNAVYTVTGFAANGCSNTATATVNGSSTAAVIVAPPSTLSLVNEGFEATTLPAGWNMQNNSVPIGTLPTWIFGTAVTGISPAQNGGANSFAFSGFNAVSGDNTISNWLIAPAATLQNGDVLTFWTRTFAGSAFPDRLEVRLSTNGASANVGATNASVGDFTTLLLEINPTLAVGGYPNAAWTQFTVTITGLPGPTNSRVAFRYFVTNGGAGVNSNGIGIDNVQINRALGGICANNTTNIAVNITGGVSPYTLVYTNNQTGTNTIFPNYTSGTPIQVSPGVTTTYTIVSVTGANGCAGSGNTGSATVTVLAPATIASQPVNATTCVGNNASFSVTISPTVGNNFTWQVSTDGGATYTTVPNAAPYTGQGSNTLTITGATAGMNNNRYRVVVQGQCNATTITSSAATLILNTTPTISTQPASTSACYGSTATFTVANTGTNSTYQWQVSTDGGLTWTTVAGGTGATLSVANVSGTQNGFRYRVIVTNPTCATTVTSNGAATLTTIPLPTVTLSSPDLLITPGENTTLTATSNPAAAANGYAWFLNGTPVSPAVTTNTLVANVSTSYGLGVYRVRVTDINGCSAFSNDLTIGGDASDRLWIYPNPSSGQFQVRLYYPGPTIEQRTVSIFKNNGQLVSTKTFVLDNQAGPYYQMNFSMPRLAAGTYLVRVEDSHSGLYKSGLLIIQH